MIDNLYVILQIYADYDESYKIYKAVQTDPNVAAEKSPKETLVKQLKDEEALQQQNAEAANKAEDERCCHESSQP